MPGVRESYYKAIFFEHSAIDSNLESKHCSLKHTFSAYARKTTVTYHSEEQSSKEPGDFNTPSVPLFKQVSLGYLAHLKSSHCLSSHFRVHHYKHFSIWQPA